jgi:MYXO-CTERM domain-containing protein
VPWQQFTYTITAITSHDLFTFHGYDATSNILLDNVTVTAFTGGGDGGTTDGGVTDAGSAWDSGPVDATTAADAGPLHDSGIDVEATDATHLDGSEDGGATSSDATVDAVSTMDATLPGVDGAGDSGQDDGSGTLDAVAANEPGADSNNSAGEGDAMADDAAATPETGGGDGSVGAAPGNSGSCGCAMVGSDPEPTDVALLLSIAAIGLTAARRRSSRRPRGVPAL